MDSMARLTCSSINMRVARFYGLFYEFRDLLVLPDAAGAECDSRKLRYKVTVLSFSAKPLPRTITDLVSVVQFDGSERHFWWAAFAFNVRKGLSFLMLCCLCMAYGYMVGLRQDDPAI